MLLPLSLFQEGATEEDALREASLHSKHAMGNLEDHHQDDIHDSNNNKGPVGPTSDRSVVDLATTYPVTFRCLIPFVRSRQLFLGASSSSSSGSEGQSEDGIHHVAFLLEQSLVGWVREVALASKLLKESHEARQKLEHTGYSRNLSLVSMYLPSLGFSSARFVHWQNAGQTGRPIELDNQNRVKALVCVGAMREALDLRRATVVHPDCGVPMMRARGYRMMQRPDMPDNMCRLQSMCERALRSQDECDDDADDDDGHAFSSRSSCFLCSRNVVSLPFPPSLGHGQSSQCPCCLQYL